MQKLFRSRLSKRLVQEGTGGSLAVKIINNEIGSVAKIKIDATRNGLKMG